jgi:hypothetical protein
MKYKKWNRLISFYDKIIGNNIEQVLELKKNENLSSRGTRRKPKY